jgi:DNA topoisomerase-1
MAKEKKTLIIVESPSKARKIQGILGESYQVIASNGHLCDLATTGKYNLGVDVSDSFKPIYRLIPDKEDKLKAIQVAARQCDQILLAGDDDREGEAISWHIGEALVKYNKPMKRLVFREITKAGIADGINNLRELNGDLFDAQQARRVLDRIVGFMVSPYLIKSFGPNLSAGRVQSVALRIITDRELEIEAFDPVEYWTLQANLSIRDESFIARLDFKPSSKKEADEVLGGLKGVSFVVKETNNEEKVVDPPCPFTTATMLSTAAKRLKMNAARATKAAQTLYEGGFVTYIRTDSIRCSDESIAAVRDYLKENNRSVPTQPIKYLDGSGQNAHEAIRPTNVSLEPSRIPEGDERLLYQMVWKRMLASQSISAVYDTGKVQIKAGKYCFVASGKSLKEKGWKAIEGEADDSSLLPAMAVDDPLLLQEPGVSAEKKKTKPPLRFKEHSLIEELEKRGVGRPSTFAAIMNKITERQYVTKDKETLIPTELGRSIVDNLKQFFQFMQIEYTAQMESRLDLIAEGKLSYAEMLKDFFLPFQKELILAQSTTEPDYGIMCDCGKPMKLRHGVYGYYMGCVDFVDCRATQSCDIVNGIPVIRDFAFSKRIVEDTVCPKCSAGMIKRDGKYGPFFSCSKFPRCSGMSKIPFGKSCPSCKEGELFVNYLDGGLILNCMRYPDCKHTEPLPAGTVVEWIPPSTLGPREPTKKQQRNYIKSEKVEE